MPVGDIWELAVDQTLYGQAVVNRHFFQQESPDGQADVGDELINAYIANVEAEQLAFQTGDLRIEAYRARRVRPNPTQARLLSSGQTGNSLGTSHSANIAGLASYQSASFLPAGAQAGLNVVLKGHTFLAGIRETSIVGGILVEAVKILIAAYIAKLVDAIQSPGDGIDFRKVLWDTTNDLVQQIAQGVSKPASRKLRSRTKQPAA